MIITHIACIRVYKTKHKYIIDLMVKNIINNLDICHEFEPSYNYLIQNNNNSVITVNYRLDKILIKSICKKLILPLK